jgi:diguanylate cyclase
VGQHVAELIVPPTLRGEFARIVAGFAASERLEDAHQRVAVPAVDRAGRELSVEVSLTATRVDGRWELTAFGHDVSERKHLEQQLRALALCDGLTGLANRRAFMEALEKAVARSMRFGHPMALLFMDMDGFKEINDCFGHHVGDLALQAFARRLERCVRKGDTIARLGGDEFTVLAEGVDSIEQAEAIARKIVEAMVPPMESTGVRLRTSIGISLYRAPADASQFLRRADHAMYQAKRRQSRRDGESAYQLVEELLD